MSITSLISPTGKPSCQDALWHVALSNNSGQTDFKYVFDVYNGTQQLIRVKVYPNPTDGRGYFDASRVVKNEITYDWFVPSYPSYGEEPFLIDQGASTKVTYQIRVGEDVSGITTLNMASGQTTAYNYVAPMLKRRKQDIGAFEMKYLSNRPRYAKSNFGEKLMIPFMVRQNMADPDVRVYLKVYNQSNSLTFDDEGTAKTVTGGFVQLDISPDTLNTYFVHSGYSAPITSSCKFYDVIIDDSGTSCESFRVYMDCDPRFTPMNLHFMNHFGMFETARFSLASSKSMSIERKSFQQKEYTFNNGSVEYFDSNNVYNESKINYNSKSNWSYRLTMNFPTDQEYEWLAELIDSPQIFAEIDGNYYPITLKATSYDYQKYQTDQLKEFTIDIEMNQTRFGFRR